MIIYIEVSGGMCGIVMGVLWYLNKCAKKSNNNKQQRQSIIENLNELD